MVHIASPSVLLARMAKKPLLATSSPEVRDKVVLVCRGEQRKPFSFCSDLSKLCCCQQKCTRMTCAYIHLPPEILEGVRKPYRLCWVHPKYRASRCPYIHYTVEKDNFPPSKNNDDTPLPPSTTSHHQLSGQHRCSATYHRVCLYLCSDI